jgi:hypothetical protein
LDFAFFGSLRLLDFLSFLNLEPFLCLVPCAFFHYLRAL